MSYMGSMAMAWGSVCIIITTTKLSIFCLVTDHRGFETTSLDLLRIQRVDTCYITVLVAATLVSP